MIDLINNLNKTKQALKNIKIGGQNLLPNTNYLEPISKDYIPAVNTCYVVSIDTVEKYLNNNSLKIVRAEEAIEGDNADIDFNLIIGRILLEKGKEYVLSFYAKTDIGTNDIYARFSYGHFYDFNPVTIDTEWKKYSIPMKIIASNNKSKLSLKLTAACTTYISQMKLEEGNIATDWSPSINDGTKEINSEYHKTYENTVDMAGTEPITTYTIERKKDVYTIFEIKAPVDSPKESTLALKLSNKNEPTYFVDHSLMQYHDRPIYTVVLQSRGNAKPYSYVIAKNQLGEGKKNLFVFDQDGTFQLIKDDPTVNNKIHLGGYGYIQDTLLDNDPLYAEKRGTNILFNCYMSDNSINKYTAVNRWVNPIKIEMNGNSQLRVCMLDKSLLTEEPAGSGLYNFTEDQFIELLNIDITGIKAKYKSSDGSIGATGTFVSQDGKTVTVKDGIITDIL